MERKWGRRKGREKTRERHERKSAGGMRNEKERRVRGTKDPQKGKTSRTQERLVEEMG